MSSPVWKCVCVQDLCIYKQGILMCISTAECPPHTDRLLLSQLPVPASLPSFPNLHLPRQETWFGICYPHQHLDIPNCTTDLLPGNFPIFPALKYGHAIAAELLGTWAGFKNDGNLNLISLCL